MTSITHRVFPIWQLSFASPGWHPTPGVKAFPWRVNWAFHSWLVLALVLVFAVLPRGLAKAEGVPTGGQPAIQIENLDQVRDVLKTGTVEQKLQAVESAVTFGPEAVPLLVGALDDPEAPVRARAIHALGKLAPAQVELAVPKLLEIAEKDGAEVEEWPNWILAFKCIGRFGQEALPILDRLWEDASAEKRAILCVAYSELGPVAAAAVPKLIALIEKDEAVNRRQAVGALMAIGPAAAPAVPVLRKALYHEDFHTQYWACRALAAIGEPALPAVPDLVDRLKNGVASVKRNAAAALGRLGPKIGPEAIEALLDAVEDPLQPVREQAVIALGRLGPEAAPKARERISESHAKRPIYPNSAACWAIWRLGGDIEPLKESMIREIKEGIYRDEATYLLSLMGADAEPIIKELEKLVEKMAAEGQDTEERANIEQTLFELRQLQGKKPG